MKAAPLEEAENAARRLAKKLGDEMPRGWGFSLFLFSFGDKGLVTYISSCQREDVVASLHDLADRIDRGDKSL